MSNKTPFNHTIGDEVYFLDFRHMARGKIIIAKEIDTDCIKGKVKGYIVQIHNEAKAIDFESAFVALEEKEVFSTKKELIYNIDHT